MKTNAASQTGPVEELLVIDDDRRLCQLIADYLRPMGYAVTSAHDGVSGLEMAKAGSWRAVILDVMLPGMDGFEVLKKLRASSNVPVLMLTARGEEPDRIVGLEIGADDYLPKTFSTRELLARLRAVTRRGTSVETPTSLRILQVGDLKVCPDNRTASLGGSLLELTPVEFDLLHSLAKARGRVKSREQLLEEIRDRHYDVFDRSIDVHISSLRKKLGDDPKTPRFIRTLRSAGYLLINPNTVSP